MLRLFLTSHEIKDNKKMPRLFLTSHEIKDNKKMPRLFLTSHEIKDNKKNAQSRNRTSDTRIFSPLLYQLSYLGIWYVIYLPRVL